jgi:high-affinity nickel-transport protein
MSGGLADAIAGVDLSTAGYLMVALFLAVWAVAVLVWRLARLENRWQAPTADEAGPRPP